MTKPAETKNVYRASGMTLAKATQELGIAYNAASAWQKEFQDNIATAKAIKLEELIEPEAESIVPAFLSENDIENGKEDRELELKHMERNKYMREFLEINSSKVALPSACPSKYRRFVAGLDRDKSSIEDYEQPPYHAVNQSLVTRTVDLIANLRSDF